MKTTLRWQPVTHGARTLLVTCWRRHAGIFSDDRWVAEALRGDGCLGQRETERKATLRRVC
jgi:hypothetical protein